MSWHCAGLVKLYRHKCYLLMRGPTLQVFNLLGRVTKSHFLFDTILSIARDRHLT